ncbi:hypothetical protein [Pseudidiomarina salilacus]|uniref:hypothetical protein n=1 Tax=Pseudidiomarina salilacus TaxID=3384452 RepID=UPI003984E73B
MGYAPNAFGEPTQAGSYATNASYYANGIVRGDDTPNGLTLWQTLDAQQRLKKREVHGGGTHVVELSYTYDANHNIQSIIDGVNGTHSVTGLSYDGLDRLVASAALASTARDTSAAQEASATAMTATAAAWQRQFQAAPLTAITAKTANYLAPTPMAITLTTIT